MMKSLFKRAIVFTLTFVTAFFSSQTVLAGNTDGHSDDVNVGEVIMHHIGDDYSWHVAGDFTIPLPVIFFDEGSMVVTLSNSFKVAEGKDSHDANNPKFYEKDGKNYAMYHGHIYKAETLKMDDHGHITGEAVMDFSITKNVASLFISAFFLLFIFMKMGKFYGTDYKRAPKGVAAFFEPIVLFIKDDIVKANIGDKKYKKFLPYLLTLFFFIWFNNLLGLMPSGANLTGNIAVTLFLALMTFIITNINGNGAYWGHIFAPPGIPPLLLIIMIPVELIGIFTKPFSLMVRLFANITAGHIIILSLICLIFIAKSAFAAVASVPFAAAMFCLELFVAILQAYVFTLLSSMYIGAAVHEHHH